jgi:iron complex outermembrane recepter protein
MPERMRMEGQTGRRSARIATVVSAVLRGLPICAPIAFFESPAALAQTFEPKALGADIPAQPVAQALEAFARQTGLQFVYVSGVVDQRRSHAVSAGLGAQEALTGLLQGTGLKFDYLTSRSIRILTGEVTPPREPTTKMPAADELQEVIVTANRREEDLQAVPMTIQVLTGETLSKLNATTFDDFVKYLPGVTAHGVGPGQNTIYVRGLGTTVGGIQASGVVGTFPNVAVYFDEQSAQLPDRNLDIYAADLERIEILEGPQGTLFGAGAEAGVVRYITNKPKLDVTEAVVNAGAATTAHGAPSGNVNVTVNVPLVTDQLAVRGVIYKEHRGGYIDNIPGTFARTDTDPGWVGFEGSGGPLPVSGPVINNAALVANDINPVTYQGIRVEALYQFNTDWSALLAQSYQSMEADGVFAEMAANSLGQPLPDLSVQLYNPSYDKDRFENTALTLNGRVGALKLLYAGAYLVRNVEQVQDYTNYTRSLNGDYYSCADPTPTTFQCFSPGATWHDRERNTHQSHELRLSTPDDWRIRGIGGLFYENYRIQEETDWFYVTAIPFYNPIAPPTGYYTLNGSPLLANGTLVPFDQKGAVFIPSPVTSNNPNIRPPGDGFFNDITRGYTQRAAYASVDIDLIARTLTLTAGTRYSRTETSEVGSDAGSTGCYTGADNPPHDPQPVPNPCVNRANFDNINAEGLDRTFSGFRSRANLSWKVTEDALLYYTWSQGFRAGGFNRAPFEANLDSALTSPQAKEHGGWVSPVAFAPDSLTNNELGWKTMWMDRRIEWNGAIYQENWNHVQIDGSASGILSYSVILNGGNYRVRGVETSGVARAATGLTLEAGTAWNHSELVKDATFLWQDGTPIDFSALHVPNPSGTLGSPLAGAPPFQGNIRARYELAFNGYAPFAQIDAVHQSHSLAETKNLRLDLQGNSTAYDLPPFTTYDGALGVGKDAWLVQIYGENLTDTRAQLYANYWQWYKAVTVSRPRTIGLRFSYSFK